MVESDIRWLQRLDNFRRAYATLQRGVDLALNRERHQRIPGCRAGSGGA
jgi:hypothetical protein